MFNPSKVLLATAYVLVIGALAATLARAVWFLALGPAPAQLVESAQPAASSTPEAMNVEQIAGLNLFGRTRSETGASSVDADAAPDTELDLKLLGIFLARQPERSVAIIGSRGNAGQAYGVGDPIFGNALVAEIGRDVVLISRAGTKEALRFEDEALLTINRSPRAMLEETGNARDQASPAPEVVAAVDDLPAFLDETVERLGDMLERDPDEMLRAVGLEPVSINGDTGYRIGQKAGSSELGRTGLQPGDTILSINGQPMSAVSQSPDAFGDLLAKDSAHIEIQRGERRFFLTTSLETLVALAAMDGRST